MFRKLAQSMGLANEPPEFVYFSYLSHKIQISFDPEDSKKEKDPGAGVTVGFLRERVRIFIQDDFKAKRQARIRAKEEKEKEEKKAKMGKGKSRPMKKGKGGKGGKGGKQGSAEPEEDTETAADEAEATSDAQEETRSGQIDEIYQPVMLSQVILIHSGKKLLDDSKPLAACGVKTGDKIMVLLKQGKEFKPPVVPKAPEAPPKKVLSPKQQIDKTLSETAKELGPMIDKYIAESKAGTVGKVAPKEQHRRLCELVLQRQFSLDDVETNGDPEIRALRKQAINTMHEYHESLDAALARYNQGENKKDVEDKRKEDKGEKL